MKTLFCLYKKNAKQLEKTLHGNFSIRYYITKNVDYLPNPIIRATQSKLRRQWGRGVARSVNRSWPTLWVPCLPCWAPKGNLVKIENYCTKGKFINTTFLRYNVTLQNFNSLDITMVCKKQIWPCIKINYTKL